MASSSKAKTHVWTPEEDNLLVECLLELRDEIIADNGFKPGYLTVVENLLKQKAPGCGLTGLPHVQSRLKTLRTNFTTVYDMLYGANSSGFGWNPDRHCITANRPIWDEYIKVHPNAKGFRYKPFPHFHALSLIFGKDRATGKDAHSYNEFVKETNVAANDEGVDETRDVDADVDAEDVDPSLAQNGSEVTTPRKKRKCSEKDESMIIAMKEMTEAMTQGFQLAIENLGSYLAREKMLDERRKVLYVELLQVQGLTDDERQDAYLKMVSDESLLVGFANMPDNVKPFVVRKLLR